ncbi:hypothetical protein CAPTEDRAFT_195996 [Capitella teleta]|uniref:C-type lectin domain-containing protein n=1 Tax=Capitella teleta TaxID=283909 RepID=R7VB85_CAPTE|nr:hypothetical protein CAPTEDRAFT_195996 [Capitella teleta]|eukprot:ELU15884.1 hypothetical protein CAPTEDRAFT_195996 [Capitella teleta]
MKMKAVLLLLLVLETLDQQNQQLQQAIDLGVSQRLDLGERINEASQQCIDTIGQHQQLQRGNNPDVSRVSLDLEKRLNSRMSSLEEALNRTINRTEICCREEALQAERKIQQLTSELNDTRLKLMRMLVNGVDKCWQGAASDEFSCYSFETSNPTTWLEAKQACLEKGGRLVVMETDEEFDFIAAIVRGNRAYRRSIWTGANDIAEEGNWTCDGSDHQIENFNRWDCGASDRVNGIVLQDTTLSDHFLIKFDLETNRVFARNNTQTCRKLRRMDMAQFVNTLQKNIAHVDLECASNIQLDKLVTQYSKGVGTSLDTHASLTEVTLKGNNHKP